MSHKPNTNRALRERQKRRARRRIEAAQANIRAMCGGAGDRRTLEFTCRKLSSRERRVVERRTERGNHLWPVGVLALLAGNWGVRP